MSETRTTIQTMGSGNAQWILLSAREPLPPPSRLQMLRLMLVGLRVARDYASHALTLAVGAVMPGDKPRDYAAFHARPIVTRDSAPDWIRERNEVLNRNPFLRIHAE